MLSEKAKDLFVLKSRVAELEREIAAEMADELAGLPMQFGFDDTASFIAALRYAAASRAISRKGRKRLRRTRKRAKITDEIRSQVRKLLEAGETGAAIARRVGISLPSVQNIKKALGMVKRRSE